MITPMSAATPVPAERTSPDLRAIRGPFDIIGDVHGCAEELIGLLTRLGYQVSLPDAGAKGPVRVSAPAGRRAVFVGDLVDRGPASPDVLRIVMALHRSCGALTVPGNHDAKFLRWLQGKPVRLAHGLELTVAQFAGEDAALRDEVRVFLETLPIHVWLDGGALAVAHAGIKEAMLGQDTGEIRAFCLYGETSGEQDQFGLPVRYHWAAEYRGGPAIVYGHTPVAEAGWVNNTLCIDTGCCFGGRLTALRWPEREIVSVPARQAYAEKRRPFGHPPVRPGADV